MPTEVAVELSNNDLVQIVELVFDTMLGLHAETGGVPWFSSEDRITASVHLSGDWNGAVLIECDHRQACRFASHFLSIETPAAVDDVVRDVLGELANMIGGNLKSIWPAGLRISMPLVVDGSDYRFRVCGTHVRERLQLQTEEGPFWITVVTMPV